MNILNIEHISKIYGEKVIFDDVSLGIHSGDKIGVIGVNGTGIWRPEEESCTRKNFSRSNRSTDP